MPELPEVESVRRALEPGLVGRTIARVAIRRRDVCEVHSPAGGRPSWARALLEGARIAALDRRGKQLAILAADGRVLRVHLGMTGSLRLAGAGRPERPDRHTHIVWTLDDGARLAFRDPRRFGGLIALPSRAALEALWAPLGPDAMAIEAAVLGARLRATRRAIKAALLDQGVLAGVGNIYADEALHRSGIHPARRADRIGVEELARLCGRLREVLGAAIDAGGSTVRSYAGASGEAGRYQHQHWVYGRGGEACRACGARLRVTTIAQRTTVYCAECQRRSGIGARRNARDQRVSRGFPQSRAARRDGVGRSSPTRDLSDGSST